MNIDKINIALLRLNDGGQFVHDGLLAFLVISGEVSLETNHNNYLLKKDGFAVININQPYIIDYKEDTLILSLYVDRDHLNYNFNEFSNYRYDCIDDGINNSSKQIFFDKLKQIMIKMKYILLEKDFAFEVNFNKLFLEFMYTLMSNFRTEKNLSFLSPEIINEEKSMSETLKYIHYNYNKSISLEEIANLNFLSPNHFSKVFKKEVGVPFSEYLQKIRMENSTNDLIYTDKSMTEIALDNGYNNYSSFYNTFTKFYNISPSNYRNKYRKETSYKKQSQHLKKDIVSFLKYMNKYKHTDSKKYIDSQNYNINFNTNNIRKVKHQKYILSIDTLDTVLRKDFNEYIEKGNELNFNHIYFNFYIDNPISIVKGIFIFYDFDMIEAFNILYAYNLIPVFKIYLKNPNISNDEIHAYIENNLVPILKIINGRFPRDFTNKFMFEISHENMIDLDTFKTFYSSAYSSIKDIFPSSKVGFLSIVDDSSKSYNYFKKALSFSKESKLEPDFITINASINDLFPDRSMSMNYYETKNYFKNIILKINNYLNHNLKQSIPTYLTHWDVLSGTNAPEIISYFRSALILEAISEFDKYVEGFAVPFISNIKYNPKDNTILSPIGLFSYGIKKSLYHVIKSINRLSDNVIIEDKDIIVTKNDKDNEIVILMWNPISLNPSLSFNNNLIDKLNKEVSLKLKNIEDGEYKIIKTIYDKENSYLGLLETSGIPNWYDKGIEDFMRHNTGEDVFTYNELAINNSITLNFKIPFNAIVSFILEKKYIK